MRTRFELSALLKHCRIILSFWLTMSWVWTGMTLFGQERCDSNLLNPEWEKILSLSDCKPEILAGIPSPAASCAGEIDRTNSRMENSFVNLEEGLQEDYSVDSKITWMNLPGSFREPSVVTKSSNQLFYTKGFADKKMTGSDTLLDTIFPQSGFFTGVRVGREYSNYWGLESRIGIAWTTLLDKHYHLLDLSNGENVVWNMNLFYYPLGNDVPLRPYFLLSTGISQLDNIGASPLGNSATVFSGIFHSR